MRIAIRMEYDGEPFAGFQRQDNAVAIQNLLEDAASTIARTPVSVTGAGRTDAGVHALGQVAHLDVPDDAMSAERWAFALNALLPPEVRIQESIAVSDTFHARFSAKEKWYRYLYWLAPRGSAWWADRAWCVTYPMDPSLMGKALPAIMGTHDFAAFQGTGSVVASTVRTVTQASLTQKGPLLILDIRGDGFLKNMVRVIAGTLMQIGNGRREPDLTTLLEGRDRNLAGITAPPHGLTLMDIRYDGEPYWKTAVADVLTEGQTFVK